jgi:hypothetical protein
VRFTSIPGDLIIDDQFGIYFSVLKIILNLELVDRNVDNKGVDIQISELNLSMSYIPRI